LFYREEKIVMRATNIYTIYIYNNFKVKADNHIIILIGKQNRKVPQLYLPIKDPLKERLYNSVIYLSQ